MLVWIKYIADIYFQREMMEQSKEHYQKAIEIDDQDYEAYQKLAEIEFKNINYEAA